MIIMMGLAPDAANNVSVRMRYYVGSRSHAQHMCVSVEKMAMQGGGYGYGAADAYDSYDDDSARPSGGEMVVMPAATGPARVNPEYYRKERGYGYEGTRTSAIDESENPAAKRRKVESVSICFDFVRGHCARGVDCAKPHVNFVESIDEREIMSKVKFCHDFQNRGTCSRGGCKFLHVTRHEEDEFLLTGIIPQSVFERMKDWSTSDELNLTDPYSVDGEERGGGRGRGRGGGARGRGRGGGAFGFGGGAYDTGGYDYNMPYYEARQMRQRSTSNSGGGPSYSQPVTIGNYCIDFLKGMCSKSTTCSLKHVDTIDDPEERSGLVKQVFCHDFQNNSCHRPFCKYLHSTQEEEKTFLEEGFFPPSLNARNREKLFFSDLCIDFLRSQCVRGTRCNFKHLSKVESFNERISLSRSIFCRDFQEQGCTRYNCKLIHTKRQDEQYFLRTGTLPDHLCLTAGPSNVDVSHLANINVCREFVKNKCNRGGMCKFYHPTPTELQSLLSSSGGVHSRPTGGGEPSEDEFVVLLRENNTLKERISQLERLLADACHCITLAVGDQNPAISALMKTIADMAPSSSLANQPDGQGGDPSGNGSMKQEGAM